MFEHLVDERGAAARIRPRVRPGARPRRVGNRTARTPRLAAAPQRATGAVVAAEQPGGYDLGRAAPTTPATAAAVETVGGTTATAHGHVDRVTADAAHSAGARGRAALARLAGEPGTSRLAAAVAQLADAVDALAGCDAADEHVADLGDAVLAVHQLRARLEAGLLNLLAAFDRRDGHREDGAVTAASWLRWRATVDHGSASTLVQAARRLDALPRIAGLLASGDITLAHATAITCAAVQGRAQAIADAEPILAELARTNPPRDVRRAVRHLANAVDPDPDPDPDGASGDPLRELTLRTGFQGRGQLEATLDPLTREALTVLLDAFDNPDPADTPTGQRRSAAQRRHDAFAALLHTLLAQPGLPSVQGARPQILITVDLAILLGLPDHHPLAGVTLADLAARLDVDLSAHDLSINTGGSEAKPAAAPYEQAAHTAEVSPQASESAPAEPPRRRARFGSGVPVDPALVRGLLPAASIMAVLTLGPWRVVNVGRKHRTLPGWLRAVLLMIHRHCRGPGCDRPGNWTQAHHLTDWAAGGDTDLNRSLPLCPTHHELVTSKGWTVTLDHTTGNAVWTSPDGRVVIVPPARS